MKKFLAVSVFVTLCLLAFCHPVPAFADDVLLAWDANTEPDIARYKIYQTRIPGISSSWVEVKVVEHPVVEALLEGYPKDGKTYYWVATAVDNVGNESTHSNMVTHTFAQPPDTTPPAPPGSFHKKTVIVQGYLSIHVFGKVSERPKWPRHGGGS